ncbi:hypothetical protein M5K25_025328 [Dendrobium thyrsiflorum]|uniref:Uncharacterized protein n=1 Tax=Dendrobium thyrsiflorum TaxID=117978 RepID=A0ABD0U440_DENTH
MPLPNTSQHFWKQFLGHLYEAWRKDPPQLDGHQWYLLTLVVRLEMSSWCSSEGARNSTAVVSAQTTRTRAPLRLSARHLARRSVVPPAKQPCHAARGAEYDVSDTRLRLPPLLNCLGCCLRAQFWNLPYCDLLPYIQRFFLESAQARVCSDELLGPNKMALSNCCFITCKRR